MKKVLGLIGSTRRLGNCEIIVKEISNNIDVPHELSLLRLTEFNILPCKGCYQCLLKEDGCVQDDDFQQVLNAVAEADALIVAAPTYFLGVHSSLKRFLDRGLAFYGHLDQLWGKPAVGVGIAGIEGREGFTLLGIENFLKMLLSEIKLCRVCYGALPGEVMLDDGNRKTAAELAKALFEPTEAVSGPRCSLCGGDTFRFLGDNQVRCMLCSNPGTIDLVSDTTAFRMEKSSHDLFLSREDVLKHRNWLLSMKDRFLQHKKELKKVCISYLRGGTWIKPEK
jgi:multimeric flavodoxin WrbA